jgi:hypothetical protein
LLSVQEIRFDYFLSLPKPRSTLLEKMTILAAFVTLLPMPSPFLAVPACTSSPLPQSCLIVCIPVSSGVNCAGGGEESGGHAILEKESSADR